ncbi:MAG: FecR family protein [Candidatus Acidiferrales bacterium]
MIRNRAVLWVCVAFVVAAMAIPRDAAYAAATTQRAGTISIILPKVELARGAQTTPVKPPTIVYWGDVVSTAHMARARIKLDDGSVLNVGSDSSLTVVKHDASNQQTQINIAYGEVRSKVVHLTKPGASFQERTPTGVAGVVGTDFDLAYIDTITRLVVFQGTVKFCNLAGQCVMVSAGQMSTIPRRNAAPDTPIVAPNEDLLRAGRDTEIKGVHHGIVKFVTKHPIWSTIIAAGAVGTTIGLVVGLSGGGYTPPTGTTGGSPYPPIPGRGHGFPPGH